MTVTHAQQLDDHKMNVVDLKSGADPKRKKTTPLGGYNNIRCTHIVRVEEEELVTLFQESLD